MIRQFLRGASRAILGVAMAGGLAGGLVGSPVLAEEPRRQITVSGEGKVAVVPDMATITLGVTNEAKEARSAMNATSAATAKVLQRLADMGVEARDMRTTNLSLNPLWSGRSSSSRSEPRRINGFVASNMVHVRLRDLADLGRILDAIIDDGANNFNGLRFSVQNPEPLMNTARQRAVADAIARARLLTDAAGVTLGAVLSMAEHGGGGMRMMDMAASRGMEIPVAAGEVTISATISMVFAIED